MSSFLGGGGGSSSLTVGTTVVNSGTDQFILYDNAGVLGNRLNPYVVATGNKTWYVSTTGSDSNDGLSPATAFATIQHAVSIAGLYDYQGLYEPFVNVASGTYTITSSILMPILIRPKATFPIGFLGGASAATTFINAPNNTGVFGLTGPTCNWSIDGFTIDSATTIFNVSESATLHLDQVPSTLVIKDHTLDPNAFVPFQVLTAGKIIGEFATVTIGTNNFFSYLTIGGQDSNCDWLDVNITIPSGTYGNGSGHFWIDDFQRGTALTTWIGATITNLGSFQGGRIRAVGTGGFAYESSNSTLNDIPGDTTGSQDSFDINTTIGSGSGLASAGANRVTGAPTTTNTALNFSAVYKDTSGGGVYSAFNDAGVIKAFAFTPVINTQTVNYTLALSDGYDVIVEMNLAGANTLTVPTNASVAFPIGTLVRVVQVGAGATTIAGAGGVTVRNAGTLAAQWATALLYKRGTNEWVQMI